MLKFIAVAALGAMVSMPIAADAQSSHRDHRDRRDHSRSDRDRHRWQGDSQPNGWDPSKNYRKGNYRDRTLGRNDRVYRGRDGRYYCKRNDGTTGLVIGGIGGGVLGNLIAPGGSKTLGTVLGAGAGALLGKSLDDNKVKCR